MSANYEQASPNGMGVFLVLTPPSEVRIESYKIPAYKLMPNSSASGKALLIYHSVFPTDALAIDIESHLESVGVVTPAWRYSMYPSSHFHSTTHEVLCVSAGRAELCFGHEDNPDRVEVQVSKGDVMLVPAGMSHRLLRDLDGGFEMIGAYPPGLDWDMCTGKPSESEAVAKIKDLEWFDLDPIYGDQNPAAAPKI